MGKTFNLHLSAARKEQWAKTRLQGEGSYAWKYGAIFGSAMALGGMIITLMNGENVYSHIGAACLLIPGSIWMGVRQGKKMWASYENAFKNYAEPSNDVESKQKQESVSNAVQAVESVKSNATTFYIHSKDETRGPFLVDQIKSMWSMGLITAEAICWQDGASETKPITDLVFAPISGESQQAILEPSEPSSKPPKSDIVSDIGNLIVVLVIVALVVFMIWLFGQI